jgi:corrinoid protein of di/trimethylamine methyltransferase
MMTPREIMLELLKPDGQPDRQLDQYEGLFMALGDPIQSYLNENRLRGTTSIDKWGTTIIFPETAPGPIPHITDETKVIKDITRWREVVHAPDIEHICTNGWEEFAATCKEKNKNQKLFAGFMATGIFEQTHFLMGFEDTLTELYEHPQEMHELIDYITEYRLTYAKMIIDNLHPDVIFSHDDWGTKNALFMPPEMWREFYKEPYRKLYGYIRSRGVGVIHHADSYLVPIIDDMIEIGIQVWQGVLPENDIPALQKKVQGKLVLMGGIGATIDREDISEEEARAYIRKALETYCPGGHYIPSITYGMFGTIYPKIDTYIDSEIEKYNKELHVPKQPLPDIPRRQKALAQEKNATEEVQMESSDTMVALSKAIRKGQKKKVVSLCQQALSEDIDAQAIISDGLMPGMVALGDDFTAGKAFVPEMLMAAKCMVAATDMLKPYLVGEGSETKGKVVLGTAKGDLHDIGKNLVKIMMEGNGLEVIDLGVDVSAETFVDTAIAENCDIIACSSLLTTSMQEMRRVVALSAERGIRDKVKIMVGGAPVSQSFCDAIGADLYTEDAASAAQEAVKLIS